MQHGLRGEVLSQGLRQGLQLNTALPHPTGHAAAGNEGAAAAIDLFLAEQGQMVIMFGNDDLGQQPGGRNAFVDDLGRHGGHVHRVAAAAGIFAANVPVHEELRRHAVQLFAHVLAKAFQGMPCAAKSGLDLVVVLNALELAWQGLAFGLPFDAAGARCTGFIFGPVFGFGFFNEQSDLAPISRRR